MKKLIIASIALLSVSSFAGETERDFVYITATTAQSAFSQAQAMAADIKSDIRSQKLPMLKNCNYSHGEAEDRTWFRRNAWVRSNQVTLNHVTGMYTAVVNVSCQK